jgi:hypothetical protein
MSGSSEMRSSSTTVTEEHSSSVTFGRSDADDDNSSESSGWSGSGGSSRSQQGWGPVIKLNAGPIWNNDDAPGKCARTCGNAGLSWTGDWKTVAEMQSVCSCASPKGGRHSSGWAGGRGSSCSAPDNHQCSGCSVSCPAGKEARCTQGDRGIFTGDRDRICSKDAKCECT